MPGCRAMAEQATGHNPHDETRPRRRPWRGWDGGGSGGSSDGGGSSCGGGGSSDWRPAPPGCADCRRRVHANGHRGLL